MNLFSKGRIVPECWNYHSCGISSVDGLTTILEVNEGHDDTRPDSLVVWLLLHLTHEFKQACAQGDEMRLRQAHRGPQECDLPALPGFLGHTRRADVGSGGLKHGTEKLSVLQRGRLGAGWLNGRRPVHPFNLASRKAAVLRNLNQPSLFELGQMVVQPVRWQAGPRCQFFGGLGSPPQTFEQANPHGVRQRPMHRSQSRVVMLRHILYYIPISEQKSSRRDGRVLLQGTEASHLSEAICGRGSRVEAVYSPLRLFEQRGIQGERMPIKPLLLLLYHKDESIRLAAIKASI